MFIKNLECTECRWSQEWDQPATVCTKCGMPLCVRYDLEALREAATREDLGGRAFRMWRYREVLPPVEDDEIVTLGEGGTPLQRLERLGGEMGLPNLFLKDEALNPTGSFKARGMALAVTMARRFGARELAAPSAGNAGGALAAYGARAGLKVHVAMPRDVPLANRVEAEVCGASVTLIDGNIADCGRWIADQVKTHGWFDLSTLKEPYRVEGKKTMGYEVAEQLSWRLPDVILYPTGGGTGLVGMWKAFEEMRALGWIADTERNPRMVAVQAAGCAPIVEAFRAGEGRGRPPANPQTIASGLRVPRPIGDRWMLRVLAESHGTAVAVEDEALLEGARELARAEGIFAGPETGALVAALHSLKKEGAVQPSDTVVLFNTGAGLKYLECFVGASSGRE